MEDGDGDTAHNDYQKQRFASRPLKGVVITVIATVSTALGRLPL